MVGENRGAGVFLAFVYLFILGVMPIISNSRPKTFDALGFAAFLSAWQVLFALPMFVRELASANRGIFDAGLAPGFRRRIVSIILATGVIFGLSTYVYVVAAEKAGAVGTAIAIQAYPLFATLWELLFLNRRKTAMELAFTFVLLGALYFLATNGTWRITGFSFWFAFALGIPFLWSVAHVAIREVLSKTPITPSQVTFFRVLVSSVLLMAALAVTAGPDTILRDMGNMGFQKFAMLMGLVYYLELINWFYAVRHIDVSVASSITAPAPAVTMILAVPFLNESIGTPELVTVCVVVLCLYGLLLAGRRKVSANMTLTDQGR